MIDIVWPLELPQKPYVNGYEEGIGNSQVIETDMDTGPSKRRRRSQSAPTPFTMPMIFSLEQKRIFTEWYEKILQGGVKTFEWIHPTKGTTAYFQFAKPSEGIKFSLLNNSGIYFTTIMNLNLLP